jgi:hypothetical protein
VRVPVHESGDHGTPAEIDEAGVATAEATGVMTRPP